MSEQATNGRPEALDTFVTELAQLRSRAGDPSFRQMAAKSGAVSHATLHLTVTGHRLQPWETVREFVRACDGDEEEWHGRWERTRLALAGDEEQAGGDTDGGVPRPWWRSKRLLVPLAVVVVAVCGAGAAVAFTGGGDEADPAAQDGPAFPGDASRLVRPVTIPDGTKVKPATQYTKVWELQNTGTVHWHDRYLRRTDLPLGPQDCRTPARIPIGNTAPREKVKIPVDFTTPSTAPADCMVRWKMVDGSGRQLFPSRRPVYFLVHVR